jgi:hypothetical protein
MTSTPYTMKKGVKLIDLLGVIRVTPRVTLFPNYIYYRLNQASSTMVNPVAEVRNQNSKSGVRIWSLKFCLVWTDMLSQQIFRIFQSRIRPCSQERICSPWLVLQVWKLQELWRSESIYSKGPNRANHSVSDLVQISSSFCLTISTMVNSISSSILGYAMFMSSKP